MICYGYKGGSGTASRRVEVAGKSCTVGAFVQANFGRPDQLTVSGVPVGRILNRAGDLDERGSIIAAIATDAPLLPHQLKRLARRVGLGIGRSGAISGHGSGDIFWPSRRQMKLLSKRKHACPPRPSSPMCT